MMYTFYFPRDDVYQALRDYRKYLDRFVAGKPSVERAEGELQRAFDHLVCVLKDEEVRRPIERHLQLLDESGDLSGPLTEFISFEPHIINSILGTPLLANRAIVIGGLDKFADGARITSCDALLQIVSKWHYDTIALFRAGGSLREWRRSRKRRRFLLLWHM